MLRFHLGYGGRGDIGPVRVGSEIRGQIVDAGRYVVQTFAGLGGGRILLDHVERFDGEFRALHFS